MSDGYENDRDRDLDDIDFEEFLNENGDLPERPSRQSTRRRLITVIGDRSGPQTSSIAKPDVDKTDSNEASPEPERATTAASDPVAAEPIAAVPIGTDPVATDPVAAKPAPSGSTTTSLAASSATRTDSGRIVKRMTGSTQNELTVAFQGEAGAYSEQALHNHYGPGAVSYPCSDFRGIFDAIHSGKAQRGILPVENSLAGTVSAAYDQLVDHDLRIQGEAILRVEHCLMAQGGLKLSDIKRVKSHPQALAQCQQTLRRLGIQAVVHYDTAGAARDLANRPEPGTAAIASALAAKTYGLDILARHVEDEPLNYTRFFLLGLDDPPRKDPSKTSVIFTTRHQPGALHQVLGELAQRGINLTKIESRPRRNRPWHYVFYMDFEGHEDQREVREALLGILKQASFLKVLGSYPAASMPSVEQSFELSF